MGILQETPMLSVMSAAVIRKTNGVRGGLTYVAQDPSGDISWGFFNMGCLSGILGIHASYKAFQRGPHSFTLSPSKPKSSILSDPHIVSACIQLLIRSSITEVISLNLGLKELRQGTWPSHSTKPQPLWGLKDFLGVRIYGLWVRA